MCLAVPGKILDVKENVVDPALGRTAMVDFQGSRVERERLSSLCGKL